MKLIKFLCKVASFLAKAAIWVVGLPTILLLAGMTVLGWPDNAVFAIFFWTFVFFIAVMLMYIRRGLSTLVNNKPAHLRELVKPKEA